MPDGPLDDVVARQYQRWVYPEPIVDMPGWLQHQWQWFDPSHAYRVMWPDRDYVDDLDILVAGCGTNQAAVLAYTNPQSRVVAVDVSNTSLDHHRSLKERYDLTNLALHQLPIEDLGSLGRDFDLIVSTGVLHHLADPRAGMRALAQHLRPDGVVAVMLYARYGRIGVEMLQSVFRDMGLQQDEASLAIVRVALASLPSDHPLASYLSLAPDLDVDAGMVDTFLHGRDRSFTVPDCLELVESAGLVFQDWLLKSSYYPPLPAPNDFFRAVAALPVAQQWAIMERVYPRNACHFFLACRPDRRRATYAIDFASADSLDYIPSFRHRCELAEREIVRYDWRLPLAPADITLVQGIDGRRTIRALIANTDSESRAIELFQSLWQLDFLAMGINA